MRRTVVKPYITLCTLCILVIALVTGLPASAEAVPSYSAKGAGQFVDIPANTQMTATGTVAAGAMSAARSTIFISEDIIVVGDNNCGLSCIDPDEDIRLSGSVSVTGNNSYGVAVYNGASITVSGTVLLSGDVTTTGTTDYSGVYADGGSVTVGGGVVTSGDNLRSVLVDNGGFVNISGGIKTNGSNNRALDIYQGSSADITGDIEVVGDNRAAMLVSSNSYVSMDGNITVLGANRADGVYVESYASADIHGNITVSAADYATGLRVGRSGYASLHGNISVTGIDDVRGLMIESYPFDISSADVTGNIYASGDSYVYGARVESSDAVIKGNITALAVDKAYGILAANIFQQSMEGNSRVIFTGDIYASGTKSAGIMSLYGSYVSADGNVTVSGADSTGLYSSEDSTIYMTGGRLYASGTDSKAMRVDGGTITLDGVTAGGAATGETLAYTESSGIINAYGSDLYGDIINANSTAGRWLAVTLEGGSSLYGTVNDTGAPAGDTGTTLALNDAASTWYVAGESGFYELDVDGATVDFRNAPAYTKVNLHGLNDSDSSLWDTGGRFIMKADIAAQTADLLTVSGVSAAHGSHKITVINVGNARTDGSEVVTLADTSANSDAVFTLTNVVEQGGWQYAMQTAVSEQSASLPGGGTVYGTLWQLRGNGASNTGDAAINNFIGSYLMSYAETNTLLQRLGQLHETPYLSGLWARVHGGKFESNAKSYVRDFEMDYGGIQIGYDRKYEIGWKGDFYAGVMFGYGKGDLDYCTAGNGEVETKTAGVYATFTSPGGFYADAVLKYVWMDNDFNTIDSAGTFVKGGEISSGGIGYSVELGQRIGLSGGDRNGWYLEPQVQLSHMRFDGGYFLASNGLHIGTEPFTSILGRLGLLVGYETEKTNLYAKVSKVREFDGELSIRANGSPIKESMKGSWWVYGLGFTSRLSDRNNIYLDVERAEGGKFTQPWRINAGYRIEF